MRTITYTLTLTGIEPADVQAGGIQAGGVQAGGVQGDHNMTALVFYVDQELWQDISDDIPLDHNIRCHVETADGTGGAHASDLLELAMPPSGTTVPDNTARMITYTIPKEITLAGGVAQFFLVISDVDNESLSSRTLYSFPARVRFDASVAGTTSADNYYGDVNGALDALLKAFPVGTEKIKDNAVTTDKLATGAVTADKLGAAAVTSAKIVAGAVTSDKLESGAVTEAKIANGAVTRDKLGQDIFWNYVTADFNTLTDYGLYVVHANGNAPSSDASTYALIVISDGNTVQLAIPNNSNPQLYMRYLAAGNWSEWKALGGEVADGSITTAKLADGAVTSAKLDDDVIPAYLPNNKLLAGTGGRAIKALAYDIIDAGCTHYRMSGGESTVTLYTTDPFQFQRTYTLSFAARLVSGNPTGYLAASISTSAGDRNQWDGGMHSITLSSDWQVFTASNLQGPTSIAFITGIDDVQGGAFTFDIIDPQILDADGENVINLAALSSSSTLVTGPGGAGKIPSVAYVQEMLEEQEVPDGAITTAKLADGAVTAEKLAQDVQSSIPRCGVCNTHQSTPDKVVELEGFTLYTGAVVAVRFVQGNYADGSLTLNINDTGAKPVYLDDNTVYSELPLNWGAVVWFCYDGGGYQVMVMPNATTDWAGKVKLNNTLTSTSDSEALTAAQGKALKDMIDGISDGGGGGNSGLPFYSQYNFNIDEVTEDCIRVVGGMTTGTKPPCNNYALVTTFTPLSPSGWSDGGYMLQMAQSDNGKLYTRYNYSTPPNWSAWQTGSN